MIKSMTGYGKGEAAHGGGRLTVEIRSVNHRYGEVYVKLPRNLIVFENDVRKVVSERLKRCKIEVFVQYVPGVEGSPLAVDINLAKAYYEALGTLKKTLGLAGEVTLQLIAAQKDVLKADESRSPDESLGRSLLDAAKAAVENIDAMRMNEGETLLADLRKRKETIAAFAAGVAQRAPLVLSDYR